MSVLTDIENREARDTFFPICDGLEGLPDVSMITDASSGSVPLILPLYLTGVSGALNGRSRIPGQALSRS